MPRIKQGQMAAAIMDYRKESKRESSFQAQCLEKYGRPALEDV